MSKVENLINELKKTDKEFEKEFNKEQLRLDIAMCIFDLRTSMNLTQVEFAKKIGVPQSTISRIG